ncbi:G patch domain-containing protein 4 [Diorhabda sublineata]|uniref:G patch domain-containing protein 4 n=1 Tax=Diorhabda sublineata TaxID=1163346 RepID=UPI0024E10B9B|nr:G patch domain-containing protein 4 [Diorhabda sublineata]
MDFARKQLEKYGWSEGKGLGKNEDGISVALKPKLKFDNTGVGHNVGEQFTNNWWEKIFNNASDNIDIEIDNKEIRMKLKSPDAVEITTKGYSVRDFKRNSNLEYGSFLKTSKLSGNSMEHYEVPKLNENKNSFQSLTDEELFAACGGRTAHKGARHGLKLSGKLSRIEKQEKLLLKKMKKISLSDSNQEKVCMEKKLKKIRKQKEQNQEKYTPIVEDSMESTSSNGLIKKKKRKNVSFSETVTVAPIYNVEVDTSFESEGDSTRDYRNETQTEAVASGSDEGIEQDMKNNNNEYSDNHRSFEVGQFNINDLSKAERKKLKKKRKLEAKQNTSTGLFLQKLHSDESDTKNQMDGCDEEEKFVNIKKRKHSVTKMDQHDKHKKKKNKRKKQKKMENILSIMRSNSTQKINSIVESLNTSCRISDNE